MTTTGGSTTKTESESVSKTRDGTRTGDGVAQALAAASGKTGDAVSGVLQKTDGVNGGAKNFTEMGPLTFPTASSLSSSVPENGGIDFTPPSTVDTTVTPSASDTMTALASQVGQAASRPPALSNNFTSLASRAGSKRSLIGGA